MKTKTDKSVKYTDGEIGNFEVIKDFLPSPQDLIKKDETTKMTLTLKTDSLEFFREEGKRLGVPYQRMIRNLLDHYVEQQR